MTLQAGANIQYSIAGNNIEINAIGVLGAGTSFSGDVSGAYNQFTN